MSSGDTDDDVDWLLESIKRYGQGAKFTLSALELEGRRGSDKAAHAIIFHARALLVRYLGFLWRACENEKPSAKEATTPDFHLLL